jgi:methionyl-tRNA formyltransferase
MDAGPICLCEPVDVEPDDDFGSLSRRLANLGGDLLVKVLDEGTGCRDQPAEGITEAPKISSEDRRLDPGLGALALTRRIRALNPHVGTWIELPGGDRLGVRRATPAGSGGDAPPAGALVGVDGRLLYGTADEALELLEVQPAGGRPMEAAAWLRGHGAQIAG